MDQDATWWRRRPRPRPPCRNTLTYYFYPFPTFGPCLLCPNGRPSQQLLCWALVQTVKQSPQNELNLSILLKVRYVTQIFWLCSWAWQWGVICEWWICSCLYIIKYNTFTVFLPANVRHYNHTISHSHTCARISNTVKPLVVIEGPYKPRAGRCGQCMNQYESQTFRTQDLSFPRTKSPYGELSSPGNESSWNFRS